MSTYEEAFCNNTTDIEFILPDAGQLDRKQTITNFVVHASNLYKSGSTGTVESCFRDGFDLGDAEANLAALTEDGEWFYDSGEDADILYLSLIHISEPTRPY